MYKAELNTESHSITGISIIDHRHHRQPQSTKNHKTLTTTNFPSETTDIIRVHPNLIQIVKTSCAPLQKVQTHYFLSLSPESTNYSSIKYIIYRCPPEDTNLFQTVFMG